MQTNRLRVKGSQLTVRSGFSSLLIIVAVVVIGVFAVLVFGVLDLAKIKTPEVPKPSISVGKDAQVEKLSTLGTSDEVSDIEKYLNETNLDTLDTELSDVDRDAESL